MPTLLTLRTIARTLKRFSGDKRIVRNILCFSFTRLRESNPSSREVIRILRLPILPAREYNPQITRNLMTSSHIVINNVILFSKSKITYIGIFASYPTHTCKEFFIRHIAITKPTDIQAEFGLISNILKELFRILTKSKEITHHTILYSSKEEMSLATITLLKTRSFRVTGKDRRKINIKNSFTKLLITIGSLGSVNNAFLLILLVNVHDSVGVIHNVSSFL